VTNDRSNHEDEDEHEEEPEERRRTFSGCEGEPLTESQESTFSSSDSLLSRARGTFDVRGTGGFPEGVGVSLGDAEQAIGQIATTVSPTTKQQLLLGGERLHRAAIASS
jgi:hypothetical protein